MPRQARRDTSAVSLVKAGWGHAKAASLIYACWDEDGRKGAMLFAHLNMLGLAIELLLKGYLRHRDYTVDQLAGQPFGHRLDELLSATIKEGLFENPGTGYVHQSAIEKIVSILNPRYLDHAYRYLDDQNVNYDFVESGHLIQPILDDLLTRIEQSGVRLGA